MELECSTHSDGMLFMWQRRVAKRTSYSGSWRKANLGLKTKIVSQVGLHCIVVAIMAIFRVQYCWFRYVFCSNFRSYPLHFVKKRYQSEEQLFWGHGPTPWSRSGIWRPISWKSGAWTYVIQTRDWTFEWLGQLYLPYIWWCVSRRGGKKYAKAIEFLCQDSRSARCF